jgi:hypothetical protein
MDLKIRNTPPDAWEAAAALAARFVKEYPERVGVGAGVAYTKRGSPTFYVYRTKTSIVVLGEEKG